jgi:hypothetical protein
MEFGNKGTLKGKIKQASVVAAYTDLNKGLKVAVR